MPIRQLAPDVAAKIAAGEVVERPASVVKELIENSIDAGATQVRVDLMHGGLQLIRVSDNGCGIAADELPLALARHATSKVERIDDLEHIRSLGFRGEALASIAAVAEVTVLSRKRGAEQGAQVSASSGQISEVTPAASPEGTTLTVRNLFSTVPARLKFLKGRNTEVGHCHHLLEQYALAYPEIRFSFFSEGRQIFATPGDGQLRNVLIEVYGLQVAEQMVPVHGEERPDDPDYPIIKGYVSRPTCYKSTRQHISFFVNRRWVLSRVLTSAVEEAYHSLLLSGRHPIAVINIELDPALTDVNVHPAKTEIRFLKERRVFAAVLRAVRQALLEEPEMPAWKPRQPAPTRNASEGEPTSPSLGRDDPVTLDTSEQSFIEDIGEDERVGSIPSDNPWLTVAEEEGAKPPLLSRLWQSHVLHPEPERQPRTRPSTPSMVEQETIDDAISPPVPGRDRFITSVGWGGEGTASSRSPAVSHPGGAEQDGVDQFITPTLPNEQDISLGRLRHLPHLRVIGQLAQSYIVTEGEDGMYLIDQHAAHERILLERMVAAMKSQQSFSQLLLTPMTLELAPHELEAIEERRTQLERIGFTLEARDHRSLAVQAVPSVLVKHMNARSLQELLLELTSPEAPGDTETWEERALANVACKAAIKARYFLTVSEMREMLEQLEQTKAPFSCCHGRPTMIRFSLASLAHEFERR